LPKFEINTVSFCSANVQTDGRTDRGDGYCYAEGSGHVGSGSK